jgi:hypothetical protein
MLRYRNEIANAMSCIEIPEVLLTLICEYDNDVWDMLQRVCQDIRILIRIPLLKNISTRHIWEIRPMVALSLYGMTSVQLRVNYINLIPSRTCKYCKSFPSFLVFIRASMVGLEWPGNGCDRCCNTRIRYDYDDDDYDDYDDNQYDPRDEY